MLTREINLGATAIGTGINAHPDYARAGLAACSREISGDRRSSSRPTWSRRRRTPAPSCSSRACSSASRSSCPRVCNDLRLLSSGPRAGFGRDQPAGGAGGLHHHAGQGQPGDPGGGEPGRLRGHRQRHHRHHGRRGRAAPAERLRADHRAQPVQEHLDHLASGLPHAGRPLRARHHRQPRAPRRSWSRARPGWSPRSTPYIGYARASEIAREALATGKRVYDLVLEKRLHDARAARRRSCGPRCSRSPSTARCTGRGPNPSNHKAGRTAQRIAPHGETSGGVPLRQPALRRRRLARRWRSPIRSRQACLGGSAHRPPGVVPVGAADDAGRATGDATGGRCSTEIFALRSCAPRPAVDPRRLSRLALAYREGLGHHSERHHDRPHHIPAAPPEARRACDRWRAAAPAAIRSAGGRSRAPPRSRAASASAAGGLLRLDAGRCIDRLPLRGRALPAPEPRERSGRSCTQADSRRP